VVIHSLNSHMASSRPEAAKARWRHYFFNRREALKTTWTLRLSVLVLVAATLWVTRGFWMLRLSQSLVCQAEVGRSDGLLLEELDSDYSVFKSAATLQKIGMANRVFVPVLTNDEMPKPVSEGMADIIKNASHLTGIELIPISGADPFSLDSAYQVRDFLVNEHISSVIVSALGFRSRRLFLMYDKVLHPAHISVGCVPVFAGVTMSNWTRTWHGAQEVVVQLLRLQYYRFYGAS
jgi:hypothetical protein